jgi:hypothetical protein
MALTQRKFFYADFRHETVNLGLLQGGEAVVAVTDNAVNVLQLSRSGHYLAINNTGQNDVILPTPAATGWTLPCDNTNGDGIEFNPSTGLTAAMGGPLQFTIGTDPAFYIQAVINAGTLANQDVYQIGFRKQAAYDNVDSPANLTVYTDLATIGINDGAGAIATVTDNDNAGIVATTLAAAATANSYVALRVEVSAAGAVTYKVGVHATTVAGAIAALDEDANAIAFSFDSTDVVIPCGFLVSTGAGATDTKLVTLECGVV